MGENRELAFSGLFSHPGRYIEEHINGILNNLDKSLQRFKPSFSEEIFENVARIIAFSHDFGKTTSYFQDYLSGKSEASQYTHHSLLSSIISYHLTSRYLNKTDLNNDLKELLKVISFIVPKRHHSNLKTALNELILEEDEISILNKQLSSINKEKLQIFIKNIDKPYRSLFEFSLDEINVSDIAKDLFKIRSFLRKQKCIENFVHLILFYSLLLDADKSDAVLKDINLKTPELIKPNTLENFVLKIKSDSFIDQKRFEIFKEIYNSPINLENKIYTLTLPTGFGKTIHSLLFALKIAEKLKQQKGVTPRIIYSLPFLSIIEQNHGVIENILKNSNIKITNEILLKYHHLSDINYKTETDEYDYWTSRVLIEGFTSQIIVTTFMQFFYSIITNKNRMLRKFHKLLNSVIILDEVQSIPHKYWKLLREIFIYLTKNYNTYIILSTATQPLIFDKEDYTEIIKNNSEYFSIFDRYELHIDLNEKTISEFVEGLDIQKDKSYLFIMNTIGSANQIFDLLKEKYQDRKIYYLSTGITPKERQVRIKLIKRDLKRGKKVIVVSTQLVEAGVDIDFDVVYRDFAPLDSIIQSAGRCNRNSKSQKGKVYVIKLKDEKGKLYSQYIYDKFLRIKTEKVLTKQTYLETDIYNLIQEYYKEIKESKSDDASNEIIQAIEKLNFDGINDFKLIEEEFYKEDIFVVLNDKAEKVFEEFKKILKQKDPILRKELFDKIKTKFYSYVIQADIRKNPPPAYENLIYYIPKENLEQYYDKEKGYIKRGQEYWIV